MTSSPCDNCGTALVGQFCHTCGQRDVDHLASVREFFAHLAETALGYDSRLWRTVKALFLRPGFLTAEYIAGRRVRYLPPLQVYLAAAALLFVSASYKPIVVFNPETRHFRSSVPSIQAGDTLSTADVARLRARGISLELFGERFQNSTTSHLSTFLVAIVPLFALVVAVSFAFRRPFAHHMLFSLHFTAFYLAMLAIVQPLPLRAQHSMFGSVVLLAGPFIHLSVSVQRTYGTSWLITVGRAAVLYFAFLFMVGNWLELVTQYTVRHL